MYTERERERERDREPIILITPHTFLSFQVVLAGLLVAVVTAAPSLLGHQNDHADPQDADTHHTPTQFSSLPVHEEADSEHTDEHLTAEQSEHDEPDHTLTQFQDAEEHEAAPTEEHQSVAAEEEHSLAASERHADPAEEEYALTAEEHETVPAEEEHSLVVPAEEHEGAPEQEHSFGAEEPHSPIFAIEDANASDDAHAPEDADAPEDAHPTEDENHALTS